MSNREWTADQRDAISAKDGTLIVSAAAGSGKTAVLIERIIERITDPVSPSSADRLLIVTFTRAATAEMRSRLQSALREALRLDPENENLQRQQMLLPSANIYTIDAFCGTLVRDNFEALGIAPDFSLLDENESKTMQKQAIASVMEHLYEENSPEFKSLVELLFSGKDDTSLEENILRLYTYSRAYPSPTAWLQNAVREYTEDTLLKNSPIKRVIADTCLERLDYLHGRLNTSIEVLSQRSEPFEKAVKILMLDFCICTHLAVLITKFDFDAVCGHFKDKPETWSVPRGYAKDPDVIRAKAIHDICKADFNPASPEFLKLICENDAELREDLALLRPMAEKLIEATLLFEEEFMRLKNEKNVLDFSDIELLALKLLVKDPAADKMERTPLADYIASRYDEILIDEYQDTNKAQDMIFRAVSKDEKNLFMVGDVKQSIYGFRQAMPDIFLEKKNAYERYNSDSPKYPASVILGKNFRSRRGVTEFVNFVFSQLMSEKCGGVHYNETEHLVCGAAYPPATEPETEFHVLSVDKDANGLEAEARFVAEYITDKVEHGGESYGSFAVLMQTPGKRAPTVEKVFKEYGIPVYTDVGAGFLSSADVQTIVSLLRVIDNPLQDIPLLAVLLSPIFGFTPDEVSQLRINERRESLYAAVLKAESSGDSKCGEFLKTLRMLRRLSVSMPAGELIRKIYEDTLFPQMVGAMPNGNQRTANLLLLCKYADDFDRAEAFGISGFVRYLDRLAESDTDPAPASVMSENADVVRIMSIHKSKGLEFKYCILMDTAKQFNKTDLNKNLILHPSLGIGLKGRDLTTGNTYPTLIHTALKLETEKTQMSEALRVLYVALTRAKEKLIIIGNTSNVTGDVTKASHNLIGTEPISPYAVRSAKSLFEWILTAVIRHPAAKPLRDVSEILCPVAASDFELICEVHDLTTAEAEGEPEVATEGATESVAEVADEGATDDKTEREIAAESDGKSDRETSAESDSETEPLSEPDSEAAAQLSALTSELLDRMAYEYPYLALKDVSSKRAASGIENGGFNPEFFASLRPEFKSASGLTPAERGTALHKFMQYADFTAVKDNFTNELLRLSSLGYVSPLEAQAVPKEKVLSFICSPIAKRIFESSNVMREKKFSVLVPAGSIEPALSSPLSEETVLIQGIADCVFEENGELVILDYKTDRTKDEEALKERHRAQLEIYAAALSECTELPVKEAYIYSFSMDKELRVL